MPNGNAIVYVTPFRRRARAVERELQAALDRYAEGRATPEDFHLTHGEYSVPDWAEGVRVEKAGRLSWAVVATPERGR